MFLKMLSNGDQMNGASHIKDWLQSCHLQRYPHNKYFLKKD